MMSSSRMTLVALVLAACGGGGNDDAPPPATPAGAPAAAPAPAAPAPGTKGDPLQTYQKVEDLVPPDEVKLIRHKFKERDFAIDPAGNENRDPFQSFVINQPGMSAQGANNPQAPLPTKCNKLLATNYALHDLKLVAILSRGLRRYALFQDTGDRGNLATTGDCVGKEKAEVKEIGDRTVTLRVVPEAAPNAIVRSAEDKPFYLYPADSKDEDVVNDTASSAPTVPDTPMTVERPGGGGL